MVRLSEQACNDWVIVGGQPCEDYAQSLLDFKPQKKVAFNTRLRYYYNDWKVRRRGWVKFESEVLDWRPYYGCSTNI